MNHMKDVAQLLGVKLGEEFRINDVFKEETQSLYRLLDGGIEYSPDGSNWGNHYGILEAILSGRVEIVRLPWKPHNGNKYYYYDLCYNITKYVGEVKVSVWGTVGADLIRWKTGNCFRTREEAETKGAVIIERIRNEFVEE